MDRRSFLRNMGFVGAGLVVGPEVLEAYERLTWKRTLFPGWTNGVIRLPASRPYWYADRTVTITAAIIYDDRTGREIGRYDARPLAMIPGDSLHVDLRVRATAPLRLFHSPTSLYDNSAYAP